MKIISLKNERMAIMEMRKHASWYLKGGGRIRNRVNQVETRETVLGILYEFANEIEEQVKVS